MAELVFAYGSNMCSGRFRDYSVLPDGHGRAAVLKEHRLRFNKRSRDGSGKANVEAHTSNEVWGVLYTVRDGDLQILDIGEGGYCRRQMQVNTAGTSLRAWVYFAREPSPDPQLRPYTWYKRFLVEGAREHGLPEEYIQVLERVEANEDNNQQRDREKRALIWRTQEVMIIALLLSNVDEILRRITLSQLSRYDSLQRSLCATDVAADPDYQSMFNGYYRMQRRGHDWYSYFFSVLEREKKNKHITFREVLEETYATKHRVEPSFSSKLVATIRPEMPVYDKHVRENLLLTVPGQAKDAEVRVLEFITVYSTLESMVASLVQNPVFINEVRPAFDKTFKSYAHFTDVKKLDLLLWQHRPNQRER